MTKYKSPQDLGHALYQFFGMPYMYQDDQIVLYQDVKHTSNGLPVSMGVMRFNVRYSQTKESWILDAGASRSILTPAENKALDNALFAYNQR